MSNPEFAIMVDWLFERGCRRLWSIDRTEMPGGMPFSLECFGASRGPVIFQVWPDRGFELFDCSGSPASLEGCKAWLSEKPVNDPEPRYDPDAPSVNERAQRSYYDKYYGS